MREENRPAGTDWKTDPYWQSFFNDAPSGLVKRVLVAELEKAPFEVLDPLYRELTLPEWDYLCDRFAAGNHPGVEKWAKINCRDLYIGFSRIEDWTKRNLRDASLYDEKELSAVAELKQHVIYARSTEILKSAWRRIGRFWSWYFMRHNAQWALPTLEYLRIDTFVKDRA